MLALNDEYGDIEIYHGKKMSYLKLELITEMLWSKTRQIEALLNLTMLCIYFPHNFLYICII